MKNFNSAEKLLKIIKKCKTLENTPLDSKEAWKQVFNIKNYDNVLLFSRMSKFMQLEKQVIYDIEKFYPEQIEIHKYWINKFNDAFNRLNFTEPFKTFTAYMDSHVVNYLTMASDLLNSKNCKSIPIDTLDDFKTQVTSLLTEISSSNIDQEIKSFIIKNLNELLLAIEEYDITGEMPISEKIDSLVGHALYDYQYREIMSKEPIGKKIWGVLNAFALILTLANELPKLPDTMSTAVDMIEHVVDAEDNTSPVNKVIITTPDAIKEEL